VGATPLATTKTDVRASELALWLQRAYRRSSATGDAYVESIARLLSFTGEHHLRDVGAKQLLRWQEDLARELAPASVNRHVAAVKSAYDYLCRSGELDRNPSALLLPERTSSNVARRILSEGEVLALLEHAKPGRNRLIIRVLYAGGLRVSELCSLHWADATPQDDRGMLVVTGKGRRTRSVPVSPATWRELMEFAIGRRDPNRPMFACGRQEDRPICRWQVRNIVRRAAAAAGLSEEISPHWLRHAHATHALKNGAKLHVVQQTLGHRSLRTTGMYLHARPGESSADFLVV